MNKDTPEIVVDMDEKCVECQRGGATGSGLCFKCITRAVTGKPMRSGAGRAVQRDFQRLKEMR